MIKEYYLTQEEIAQAVLDFINGGYDEPFPNSIDQVEEISFWVNENMINLTDLECRVRHED